jgi:hypothetical protein
MRLLVTGKQGLPTERLARAETSVETPLNEGERALT